jgi:hypothetical protein
MWWSTALADLVAADRPEYVPILTIAADLDTLATGGSSERTRVSRSQRPGGRSASRWRARPPWSPRFWGRGFPVERAASASVGRRWNERARTVRRSA